MKDYKVSNSYKFFIIAVFISFFIIHYKLITGERSFSHDQIIWSGSYHYYMYSMVEGNFPYWDPYMLTGTPFYQNIHHKGLLDPTVLMGFFLVKVLGISSLASYVFVSLAHLFIFVAGAYILFRYITACALGSLLSALVLLFSIGPTYFREGSLDVFFLAPLSMFFILRFFEDKCFNKKCLYLLLFALASGITMVVFIPSYFLLNLIFFLPTTFALGVLKWRGDVKFFSWKTMLLVSGCFLLVVSMMAPSLVIYLESHGTEGELIPTLRILQKNDGVYKKMIASDFGENVLSDKFTKHLGVYSSYGNMFNLLYPDLWRRKFIRKGYNRGKPRHSDFISETFQYLGIIPFILAIIGFIYSKSRWRWIAVIMGFIVAVNMLSFYGVRAQQPNAVQKIFNTVLPFLKMIEVRENFASLFLFYLAMLLSLALKIFFDNEHLVFFLRSRWRSLAAVGISLILIKIAIAGLYFNTFIYISNKDIAAFILIILFFGWLWLYGSGRLTKQVFLTMILIVSFADLFYYNATLNSYTLRNNFLGPMLEKREKELKTKKNFDYFRNLTEPNANLAFADSIFRVKDAFSGGYNSNIFTTKRYYDYIIHVPLEKQIILSGLVLPIIRFFPEDKIVEFKDRREVLKHIADAKEEKLYTNLYLEKGPPSPISLSRSKALDQFENAPWLTPENIIKTYKHFISKNQTLVQRIKQKPDSYVAPPGSSVEVVDFTVNSLKVAVKNSLDGYLYYNDGWSLWWRAFDNGREIPIRIANYNFKAVFLEKGTHIIRFVYDPIYYRIGIWSYYIGLAVSIFLIIFFLIKMKLKEAMAQ